MAGMQRQRIAVGVDGSAGSRTALRWALDEARRRGATIDAVHAWTSPVMSSAEHGAGDVDATDVEAAAKLTLDEAVVDATAAEHSDVLVQHVLRAGHPARILLEAARGADLLVVGNRGSGGFAGLLLGSVGQACISHAPCPVVVVPSAVA